MKRTLCMLIGLCFTLLTNAQATDLVIDCQTPGWLSSKINYGDQLTVRNLKVTGYINSTDLKFIGKLIADQNLHEKVDLSDVNIVNNSMDKNCFGISANHNKISLKCLSLPKTVENLNNILPHRSQDVSLQIDTLYFNCNIKYIAASMFDGYQYGRVPHHIIVEEKVDSIPSSAFSYGNGITGMVSVKLPSTTKYIGENAFSCLNTNSSLNFNDLEQLAFLGWNAFTNGLVGYCPDTIRVPKSLQNPYYLFAFAQKDGQHIFIEDNISTVSGNSTQSGVLQVPLTLRPS